MKTGSYIKQILLVLLLLVGYAAQGNASVNADGGKHTGNNVPCIIQDDDHHQALISDNSETTHFSAPRNERVSPLRPFYFDGEGNSLLPCTTNPTHIRKHYAGRLSHETSRIITVPQSRLYVIAFRHLIC